MNSKNKTKFIFIFSLALLCYSSVITKENVTVKVGIETHKNKFRFTCGEYKHPVFIQTSSGKIETIKISQQVTVKLIAKNKIKIGNKRYSLPVKLYSAGNIVINNNFYPGEIELIPTTNGFNIVNTLSLQQYLYGVIPYEIEPTWTDEMLKIQSIISRTYALANLGRHKHDGFDFCNTMHCQVYKGLPRDESFYIRIKKYIDITDGLVVVNKQNNIVQTYYHAACGGETENIAELWSTVYPYEHLHNIKCSYCQSSPYFHWQHTLTQQKFISLFYPVSKNLINKNLKVTNIIPSKKTSTGRVLTFIVHYSNDKTSSLSIEELYKKLGYTCIKSAKIYNIDIDETKITFYGKGWGHGVGLCQWGANTLTKQGKKFDQVIKYYYQKTKIKKL